MSDKVFPKRAMLVYQGGIANVFAVTSFNLADFGRDARLLHQSSFAGARMFAAGMGAAGCIVRSAACNEAGDITHSLWSEDFASQPFSEQLHNLEIN